MIKNVLAIIFFFGTFFLEGQNWSSVPLEKIPLGYVEHVFFDSIHDKLIISSKCMNYAGGRYVRGIASWDGIKWDSLSSGINTYDSLNVRPDAAAFCSIEYNGKLLVGGDFYSIGKVRASGLALWDGTYWDSLSVRAFKFRKPAIVYGFLRANNKLYIHGDFDTIQGQPATSLATFDGTSFQPVNFPLPISSAAITCMVEYKGSIYLAGNITTSNSSWEDIFSFNGSGWSNVGGGIKGVYSSISSMVVYNDTLYAAGYISKASGNAGNIIMKWDGSNWHDAGWGGLPNFWGIYKMIVYHNKIYAFGDFDQAANMPASKVAVYDGSKWCSFADTVDYGMFSASVYHDTIYATGPFEKINSDTNKHYIAKLVTPNLYNQCVMAGISEIEGDYSFQLYPNPFQNTLRIKLPQLTNTESLSIVNSLGQTVFETRLNSQQSELNLSFLPDGIYFLNIRTENKTIVKKIVKQAQ